MLYDHRIDEDENVNVVDNSKYAEDVERLKAILHTEFKNNITGEKE
jgi:hypothetical protein